MNKPLLRSDAIQRLSAISQGELQRKKHIIVTQLLELIALRQPASICCYQAMAKLREVDTDPIISALDSNKSFELTVVEPRVDASLPKQQFDLIIVPVVAFDRQHNRIGRGGGWYDRFLATQDSAYKVGLAYSEQFVNTIDVEPHDIALDTVLYA